MVKKFRYIYKIIISLFIIYGSIKSFAHAETLTKLNNYYTNEEVMQYLLDNITIYTNKPIDRYNMVKF